MVADRRRIGGVLRWSAGWVGVPGGAMDYATAQCLPRVHVACRVCAVVAY